MKVRSLLGKKTKTKKLRLKIAVSKLRFEIRCYRFLSS
jgi:hypothetical protein